MQRIAFRFVLAALAAGAACSAAMAQTTPPDLRDLVGARAPAGEAALTSRGFASVGGQTGDDRRWTNWWNARRSACVTVATQNGRFVAITATPAPDCRPQRPTTLPGPVGPPVPNGPRPTTLPGPIGPAVNSGRTEDIRFDRGSSSATRRGSVRGYDTMTYVVDLRAGDHLSVLLQTSNRSAYFNITAPRSDRALFNGSIGGARYQGRVVMGGRYRIMVYLMRNAARRDETARYTLDVGSRR